MKKIIISICAALMLGACAETRVIDRNESANWVAAELTSHDLERMAKIMLDDLLNNELSGDKRFIMEVAQVRNDTMQKINTADLTDYMRRELRRSGRVRLTNLHENASVAASRDLANKSIMDQSTVMQQGRVVAPDVSLFGRIQQRDFMVDGKRMIEYTFSLAITDLKTGLEIWSKQEVVTKLTHRNRRTW
ncbi:MAG: penicillin-binding protein activator LpoB [Alphaproteobacteria bacterium]|nr:penicillin-binding protein activator LpoB [Alphaproteobacteria bacterium]